MRHALAVLGLWLLLCGCGNAPTATPTSGLERQKPADQIVADSRLALGRVSSVHLIGSIDIGGHHANLDVTDRAGSRGRGIVIVDAVGAEGILVDDVLYLRGARAVARFEPPAVVSCVGDRWVIPPPSAGFGPIQRFFDIDTLRAALLPTPPAGTRLAGDGTVHGQPALRLEDRSGRVIYVAAAGPPLPLRISRTAPGQTGNLDFINYGAPGVIEPPSGSVDLSHEQARCTPVSPSA